MKARKKIAAIFALIFASTTSATAYADWHLESVNSTTGLSAYASTYWIDGIGTANYDAFGYYKIPFDTFFAAMMIQCTKKKYTATFTMMQTGSAHDDLSLDDPGFI